MQCIKAWNVIKNRMLPLYYYRLGRWQKINYSARVCNLDFTTFVVTVRVFASLGLVERKIRNPIFIEFARFIFVFSPVKLVASTVNSIAIIQSDCISYHPVTSSCLQAHRVNKEADKYTKSYPRLSNLQIYLKLYANVMVLCLKFMHILD